MEALIYVYGGETTSHILQLLIGKLFIHLLFKKVFAFSI